VFSDGVTRGGTVQLLPGDVGRRLKDLAMVLARAGEGGATLAVVRPVWPSSTSLKNKPPPLDRLEDKVGATESSDMLPGSAFLRTDQYGRFGSTEARTALGAVTAKN
jgi:hypothetical protein